MKTKLSVVIISLLIVLTSCNNDTHSKKNDKKKINLHECDHDKPHKESEEEEHFEKRTILKLNGDEKWVLNEATSVGMTKINEILSNFYSENRNIEDYINLSERISEQTNYIIKKCDMTGEGHNQLHLLLNDFLPKIKELESIENIDKGKLLVESISNDVKTYFEYFVSE